MSTHINRFNTLVDLLRWRAERQGQQLGYLFLADGEQEEIRITYGELDRQARAIAAQLQALKTEGQRALLLYPPGLGYIAAFLGCLYAGVTAVPAYPPRLNRPVPRIQAIVADSQATVALTTTEILESLEQRFEHTPDLQALDWLDTERLPGGAEQGWRSPDISPETLAFIQYTSGSTSTPKGVMLAHANLLHNLEEIRIGFQMSAERDDVGVSWLPGYHDMGLIGCILEPMYTPCSMVLMAPFDFLQRPIRWLRAITRYRGTICGGPNFAYDLCVAKVRPEQLAELDLSSWRLAFSGAEPVRLETLNHFAEKFAACGFRRQAFYPCYGLAEASLYVSGGDGAGEPVALSLSRAALERHQIEEVALDAEGALTLVGCGSPKLGTRLEIVDPETRLPCPPGQVGEIWVSGGSLGRGYWDKPEESQRTFREAIADDGTGPFLRTGDLGFLKDGQLYVTGRIKDLIIIRGGNYYPQDLELTVEQSHSAIQPGGGAAFSIEAAEEERLVIVYEVTRQHRHANLDEVIRAVRQAISENHDLQVYAIALLQPFSVPKTSSGKIQRHACKEGFLTTSLEVIKEWRAPI